MECSLATSLAHRLSFGKLVDGQSLLVPDSCGTREPTTETDPEHRFEGLGFSPHCAAKPHTSRVKQDILRRLQPSAGKGGWNSGITY